MTRIFAPALTATLTVSLAASLVAMPASAQTQDHAPAALQSAPELRHDKGEAWTYIKPGLDFARYKAVVVEDTAVYKGPDAQFKDLKPEDRAHFAALLTQALRSELATAPGLGPAGPGVLRVKATILGAEKTTGGAATATRVMPIGLVTNAVKSVAGKPGSLTGSVLAAVEISDSATGELLAAAVRREAPDALDIPATVSTADTVKAVARGMAKKLRERLEKALHKK